MEDIVLDTNIISYAIKNDSRRLLYEKHVAGKRSLISFVTVAELYRWAIARKWGTKRIKFLQEELARHVIVPFDDALAWQWARARSIPGVTIDLTDAWIAATALRWNLPLVTHNRKHFEAVPGLKVISES